MIGTSPCRFNSSPVRSVPERKSHLQQHTTQPLKEIPMTKLAAQPLPLPPPFFRVAQWRNPISRRSCSFTAHLPTLRAGTASSTSSRKRGIRSSPRQTRFAALQKTPPMSRPYVEHDGPVVLVGHSYGGQVISNAAVGHKNVKALVFVAAFAPEKGEDHSRTLRQVPGKHPGRCIGSTCCAFGLWRGPLHRAGQVQEHNLRRTFG